MTNSHAVQYDSEARCITCSGVWSVAYLELRQAEIKTLRLPSTGKITIDGQAISKMDTAGAWLLNEWVEQLTKRGLTVDTEKFSSQHESLMELVNQRLQDSDVLPIVQPLNFMQKVGTTTVQLTRGMMEYLSFVGLLSLESLRLLTHPKRLRWSAFAGVVYRTGYAALPIIALLSFMIGVVITYQMGLQLKNYGANIFIVDLLGLAILREFGPLITAIMVAGRSGSAFTAQLGMMKLNQEIDALDTMGVTPSELLLLPRIAGLVIALPLLTIWADILGVFGGMVMSNTMLNITWYDFLQRFPSVIPMRALLIGFGKAPVFAMIIASIGCYQGMKVSGGADSVGTNTTRSVVLAIFFIIVADAIFSIIFSELKL